MKHILLLTSCLFIVDAFAQSDVSGPGIGHQRQPGRFVGWSPAAPGSIAGSLEMRNDFNFPITFHTNGTQRMYIANGGITNGFVGIGSNFSTPIYLLHINGTTNATGNLFRTTGSDALVNRWVMAASAPGFPNSDAERFFIESPGFIPGWPLSNYSANIGTSLNGEINFFTNRDNVQNPGTLHVFTCCGWNHRCDQKNGKTLA